MSLRQNSQSKPRRKIRILGFQIALGFLTIIPSPQHAKISQEDFGHSLIYFPLVGLILGLLLFGLDKLLGLILPLQVVNILLIIALLILTGALHLDGFVDTCDGVASSVSPSERIEIMSDSRAGSFGVAGACCLLLLKYFSLAAIPLPSRTAALILMPLLSRWVVVYPILSFPYAKKTPGLGQLFKQGSNWQGVAIATSIALASSLAVVEWWGAALMATLWLLVFGVATFLHRRLGGLTGDTYGAIIELSEVFVLILVFLLL
jgi:adenosylcobinamide-GDP ribazoletransferase